MDARAAATLVAAVLAGGIAIAVADVFTAAQRHRRRLEKLISAYDKMADGRARDYLQWQCEREIWFLAWSDRQTQDDTNVHGSKTVRWWVRAMPWVGVISVLAGIWGIFAGYRDQDAFGLTLNAVIMAWLLIVLLRFRRSRLAARLRWVKVQMGAFAVSAAPRRETSTLRGQRSTDSRTGPDQAGSR